MVTFELRHAKMASLRHARTARANISLCTRTFQPMFFAVCRFVSSVDSPDPHDDLSFARALQMTCSI